MRLDTASRGFLGLLGIALGAYVVVGVAACLLLALLSYRVATGGAGVLASDAGKLWPALIALAVVAAGLLFSLRSLVSQLLASLRLNRRIRELALPPRAALSSAVARTRLRGRVTLIDVEEAFSFAYGALRPQVAVSRGLLDAASQKELEAVLAHERYHVRNLDPLKVLLARALPQAFFYVPALREFERRYLAGRELAADRLATEHHGSAALAGALLKVVGGPKWRELQAATAIGGPDVLDARIAQLEEGREPRVAGLSLAAALRSFIWLAVLGFVLALAVEGSGGPSAVLAAGMPGMEREAARLALMPICFIPWVLAAWLAYLLLRVRAARQLGPEP